MKKQKQTLQLLAMMGIALTAGTSAIAGSDAPPPAAAPSFVWQPPTLASWWNGSNALAGWGGLAPLMKNYGLSITGSAKEAFFGQVGGGMSGVQKGNWVNEEKLGFVYDFAPLFGLNGLTIESNWRYRNIDGSPNVPYTSFAAGTTGNSSMFAPSRDAGGLGPRIMTQFLQWKSDKTADPRFLVKAGWVNPYEDFLQQPLSKMFENNAIAQSKGIGGANGPGIPVWSAQQKKYVTYGSSSVPWSGSYASWGGSLRAKPSSSTYVQSGLYLAIGGAQGQQANVWAPAAVYPYSNVAPGNVGTLKQGTQTVTTVNAKGTPNGAATKYSPNTFNNNGINFQGAAAFNPNGYAGNYTQNGLYNVNEIGWTPKFGADKLEGKYAIGGYIWGQNNTSYQPTTWVTGQKAPVAFAQNSLTWGLYLQADQRLYAAREASSAPVSLDGKNPVAPSMVASKTKGLYMFNEFSYTPGQNNAIPFYFQTGLVYKGLIPHRDKDSVGIALGAGFYSSYLNSYINSQNETLKAAYNGSNVTAANTVPDGPTSVTTSSTSKVKGKTVVTKTTTSYYAYQPTFSSTEVLEAFYNVQVNKWASVKPFAQYIVNPAGNGTVVNDFILGVSAQVNF
jgi:porin